MGSVFEESREGDDSIKVFVRVRPAVAKMGQKVCVKVESETNVLLGDKANPRTFSFDHVADQPTSQDVVFAKVGRQIVESCVEGYNGTIFAYGQTGSGKTYTMLGPAEDSAANFTHHLRGVIPRSLEYMFQLIERKQDMHGKLFECYCKASFLEIYNEQVFDLLDAASTRPLQLREGKARGIFVDGIIEKGVKNGLDAYSVLSEGWRNRRVASTSMNRESSRSHAVFTLTVETKEYTGGITKFRQSVLNLVDLAGSERQRDTQASGLQLREAGKINGSLSVLGQVIMALDDIAHKKERHIPYRESKLTFLLRDSLGGNAKTYIIVNVHPNSSCYGETLSTLQFAQRAKQIKNRARVNENTQGDSVQLQNEIKRLKRKIEAYEKYGSIGSLKDISTAGEGSVSEDHYYKERFYKAMLMRQQQNKLILALRQQLNKINKFNMSRTLIIKLRNSRIETLENGREISTNEQVTALEEELDILRDQLAHHPEVAGLMTKLREAHNEVERLKSDKRMKCIHEQEAELEELYLKLTTELQPRPAPQASGGTIDEKPLTPVSPAVDAAQKTKIFELEQKLKEQQAELSKLRDANSSLEADLKGNKIQVKELEKVLKITSSESSVHRRRLNSMHENTLRFITTPKRSRDSRGRDSCPSASKIRREGPILFDSLNTSFDEDDPFHDAPRLQDEKMPDLMVEVVHEALQEELKKVKEETEKYKEESLQQNCEIAALRNSESSLKEKLSSCMQSLSEKNVKLEALEKECSAYKSDAEMYRLEVRDLRILLKSADEELKETKGKLQTLQKTLNKRMQELEAKYFALQTKSYALETEKEKSLQEAQTLAVDVENLRMEVDFVKNQLAESNMATQDAQATNKAILKELKETSEKLECEKSASALLREQLEGESRSTSDALASHQDVIFNLEKQLGSAQEEAADAKEELEEVKMELQKSQKSRGKDQSAIQALVKQVTEFRGSVTLQEIANSGLHADIDEITSKLTCTGKELEGERARREEAERKLAAADEEFAVKESKHQFDMEILQEDLLYWSEQSARLTAALEEKNKELELSKQNLEELQRRMKHDAEKLKEQQALALKAEQAELSVTKAKEENIRLMEDAKNHKSQLEEVVTEYMSCRDRVAALEGQVEEAKDTLTRQNELFAKNMKQMQENLEAKHQVLVEELRAQVAAANEREMQAISDAISTDNELKEMQAKAEAAQLKLGSSQEEYDRIKVFEQKQFAQVQELTSKLEEMSTLRCHAQERLEKLSAEKEKLMAEVASLAGHHNHSQRISYLGKLKKQISEMEKANNQLRLELRRVTATLQKQEPDYVPRNVSHLAVPSLDGSGPLSPKDLNKCSR